MSRFVIFAASFYGHFDWATGSLSEADFSRLSAVVCVVVLGDKYIYIYTYIYIYMYIYVYIYI